MKLETLRLGTKLATEIQKLKDRQWSLETAIKNDICYDQEITYISGASTFSFKTANAVEFNEQWESICRREAIQYAKALLSEIKELIRLKQDEFDNLTD